MQQAISAHLCTPVEVLPDGIVSLLACCVPDLQLEDLVVHLNPLRLEVNPCNIESEASPKIESQ